MRAFTAERRVERRADHLHLAVGALGQAGGGARQHGAGRRLGVYGVGLAGAEQIPPLGADHLAHLYPLGGQETGEARAEGARSLHAHTLDAAEILSPPHEPAVTILRSRHAYGAQAPAEPIEGDGDVGILMGVHTQSNSNLGAHESLGPLHTLSPLG